MVVDNLYYNTDNNTQTSFTFPDEVIRRALLNIYSQDFHPASDIEQNLFNEIWRTFNLAADRGFNQSDAPEPDDDFRNAIRHNNAVFSAFKVHRMQNDMAQLLLDDDGNLKTFEQWRKEALPIASHQCGAWLRTEYDTAVIRAHQAADWLQFQREKDILPNLRWVPSTSPNPGKDHRTFWNTILPVDDPFWTQHRPGDRWNCKCSLSATDEPTTTAPRPSKKDRPQPGLDNNPANDRKLFADSHPYIAHPYHGAQKAVNKLMEEQDRYRELAVKNGRLRIHEGHGKREKKENVRIGTYLAEKHGYEIDLLDNPDNKKSADSFNRTLGVEQEYKVNTSPTISSIDNLLRKAKDQADDIVLWIESDISLGDLRNAIYSRVRRTDNIQSLTIVKDGKDAMYKREEILKNNWEIRQADFQ